VCEARYGECGPGASGGSGRSSRGRGRTCRPCPNTAGNGAKEFWVVDPDRRQVKVSTPDGRTIAWQSGQEIPLPLFAGGGAGIAVDAIFA
jgi:hypothetical protein